MKSNYYVCVVSSAALLCAPTLIIAATVSVDLAIVTNANAPLLLGEGFNTHTSFTIPNQPIGYYSSVDGSPLAIGQYWEDTHRQTALRFPMAPVNVWNWKATIDPFKASQPLLGNQVARFGLDEFMEMADRNEMLARDVHMMVNIYRNVNNVDHAGAVQDAADLVAYLNKPWDGVSTFSGSNWEALRAANGHPAPYGVELFNLGNEPWAFVEYDYRTSLNTDPALNGAKRYTADMANFIAAMKAVDPAIKITLPATGPIPNPMGLSQGHAWNQTLIDNLGTDIYGLSVNLYYDSEIPPIRGVNVMKSGLDHLNAITTAYNQNANNQLHVMIGEHAHAIDLDQNNQPVEPGDPDFAMQWQGAVGTADFLMMAANLNYLERAHFFIYGNGKAQWHPMRLDGYDPQGNPLYTVMPAAKLYEILGPLVLDEALAVTTMSPASLDNEDYSIRAGAFRSADDSMLTVVVVNRDSLSHDVDLLGLGGYSLLNAQLLTAAGPLAETINVTPFISSPNALYTLPGLSIAILQLQSVPEPASGTMLFLALLGISAILARRNRCEHVVNRTCGLGSERICDNIFVAAGLLLIVYGFGASPAHAFIYKTGDDSIPTDLAGGLRWDSVPRMIGGSDRSLAGGISWNVAGGSFAAYKSQFAWAGAAPTDAQFQSTIEQVFSFWTSVDSNPLLPVGAPFSFVFTPGMATTDTPVTGAEIDLLASDLGFVGAAGGTLTNPILNDHVRLTSGTSNYSSDVIGGIDININNHPGTTWTLLGFRALLAHEIGHSLGLGHADLGLASRFVDDDYSGASQSIANDTLTNHFSHLINPLDPSNSPLLNLYTVPNTSLGTNASGVHILMERFLDAETINASNPLSPDDYAQRQFLYPTSVPEPGSGMIFLAGLLIAHMQLTPNPRQMIAMLRGNRWRNDESSAIAIRIAPAARYHGINVITPRLR